MMLQALLIAALAMFSSNALASEHAEPHQAAAKDVASHAENDGVRVGLPNVLKPTTVPAGCLSTNETCSFQSTARAKFTTQIGVSTITLDTDSAVIRKSDTEITLIEGAVWVKAKKGFHVATEYGSVRSFGESEYWVIRENGRMKVLAISERVALNPRGLSQSLRLEPGEENWIGGVESGTSFATTGIPQPIVLAELIGRWAKLYSGTKAAFTSEVEVFKSKWSRGLAPLADYHRSLASSHLETLEREAQSRAKIKAQHENRSQELRNLYRRKVLLD